MAKRSGKIVGSKKKCENEIFQKASNVHFHNTYTQCVYQVITYALCQLRMTKLCLRHIEDDPCLLLW
jgi:hypothetical protein